MFNQIKTNIFYNKLINNRNIDKNFFNTIDNALKERILADERFAENIKLELIIKEEKNDNTFIKIIDKDFIKNLTEDKLKTLFKRLLDYNYFQDLNLTNIFSLIKEKYINTHDIELKEIISELLFATVKESFFSKEEYINQFITLFNKEEKLKLFETENMVKFITFHSKHTDPYYGYKNFFNTIFNDIIDEEIKYNMFLKIFDFMPKTADVKRLFLESILKNLNINYITKILENNSFIEEFKYKGETRAFNYELLLDIIILTTNYELKKRLIGNYFCNFENAYTFIKNRNDYDSIEMNVDGQTIKAFYELKLLGEDIDDLIIKSCKDELLFEILEKYENKQEKLLEIPRDVDMNLLIEFSKKHNIEIYTDFFAQYFSRNEQYFHNLPLENIHLLQYYIGDNNEMFFEKLAQSKDPEDIIYKSLAKIDLAKALEFAKEKNIDLYSEKFIAKFKKEDKYFASLPSDKSDFIRLYNGQNLELFFNKLSQTNNKIEILFFNNLDIEEDVLLKETLNLNYFNEFDKKLIKEVLKIQDKKLKTVLKQYINNNYNEIPENQITVISELLNKIELSNSIEILNFRTELANQLLATDTPIENLSRIENIFIKNNLPTVGKLYSVFDILHPNFENFNFDEDSKISPVLKSKSKMGKKATIFSDLLKASLGSNNRSLKEYINNLEVGNKIYKLAINNKLELNELDNTNKNILQSYLNHLITLYNNTLEGKKHPINLSNKLNENILTLSKIYPNTTELPDKIVKMFCYFAGFETLESLKQYMQTKIKLREIKNYKAATQCIDLEEGDLIKGICNIDYLKNILQNGSVSKEYLGAYSSSDATPLDTDLSKILNKKATLAETIKTSSSRNYGPIWLVLKNDGRFTITRNNNVSEQKKDYNNQTYELFYTGHTGNDHFGIRTGFASSDIDYIIAETNDPRINLEVAMNGFYIPVFNLENELIFTPEEYKNLRSKMVGSYYDINSYNFSSNLLTNETQAITQSLPNNHKKTKLEQQKIFESIEDAINSLNLTLKDYSDGDLSEGSVQLINTGSTGRGTNLLNDSDHDFMMRLDNNILLDPIKLQKLKEKIINSFESIESQIITRQGDFRFTGVKVKGLDNPIKLDITFTQKTNKINYSTDSALKDRLSVIKNIDNEKYNLVIANILLAKQVLKSANVYKPKRASEEQGGLGGVGVENWILNNGGSFIDAIKTFLEAANNKTFEEFKKAYQIWDFGENYMSDSKANHNYLHDNFVDNMNEVGYNKMKVCLKAYLDNNLSNIIENPQETNKKL